MNNVHAWVVGIDRYDQSDWSLSGPCANALAVVEWLLRAQVPPHQISLFIEPRDAGFDTAIGRLEALQVNVQRRADRDTIDTFWRATLYQPRPPDSRLFVYWSGHGFADDEGNRTFVCRNYQHPQLDDRVFNSSNVLRHLRSLDYQHFGEQLFLADVCALKANVSINANKRAPIKGQSYATQQLAFYATPEGEYARGNNGRGAFTEIALRVLQQFDAWPPFAQFHEAMVAAFKEVDQAIFRVGYRENEADIQDRLVGALPASATDTLYGKVFKLLVAQSVPDSIYRQHFLRTVSRLGEPALASGEGLTGMLQQLASLKDDVQFGQLTHGMLQFLLRLRQEPALTARIDDWLAPYQREQANMFATIREQLEEEASTKILIVEVNNDREERIVSYDLLVRTSNLVPVPGVAYPQREVKDWDDFVAQLLNDLNDLRDRHGIADFQIQFLVNPPLFDRKFHAITVAVGDCLGDTRIVLVRHKDRVRSAAGHVVRDAWHRYAEAVRRYKPAELCLLPIQVGIANKLDKEGLCYSSFLVPPPGPNAGRAEKETLARLLRAGVTYVYWLHDLPIPDAFEQIKPQFTAWLNAVNSIDEFPLRFTQQRLSGNRFAADATLLWDDPQFNPFRNTRGVSQT